MILQRHSAEQANHPKPFNVSLSEAYVLTESREPYEIYQGREIRTILKMKLNHIRPRFELKLKLSTRSKKEKVEIGLENLKISTTEQKLSDKNEHKEVRVQFTKGTVISAYAGKNQHHHTETSTLPEYPEKVPDTTKTIMSRMAAPILLKFVGGKHEMLTINLALGCPNWAKPIRDMVFSDSCMLILVDVGHNIKGANMLKEYMEHGEDPLTKFYPSGPEAVNGTDTSGFIANPFPSGLLGFCASSISKDWAEHKVVRLAAVELDHEPEARKIRAFERSTKALILIDFSSKEYPMVYEGLISKPNSNECSLQTGQQFDIQFGRGKWNPDTPPWFATVVDGGSVKREGYLSVLIRRGRYKKSATYSKLKPHVVNATRLKDQEVQDKVSKDPGNFVRAKLVDHDSAYKNIRAAYVAGPSRPRIREMLLGLRIDLLESIDLYRHIKDWVPDFQKYMKNLNPRQQEVLRAARHILGGILIFQGPPGTGKTYTLRQLIKPFINASKQKLFLDARKKPIVLVAAPTNAGANDLAQGICEDVAVDATEARKPYVLRAYPEGAEDEISRTQGPRPKVEVSKSNESSEKTASCSTQTRKMSRILEEFQAADKPKFEGVRDKRVSEVGFSVGYMRLLISGVVPDSEYAHPQAAKKFDSFRALYKKQSEGAMLTEYEERVWKQESEKLTEIALQGASVIVSTTANISNRAILKHVEDRVVAVFLDESAFEREDSLMPLFSTKFSMDPCFIMAGDQQQLEPITKHENEVKNDFKSQLEISVMARLITIGVFYTMLTEQHRMVDQISEIANKLTYRGQLINDPCTEICERPLAQQFQRFAEKRCGSLTNRLMIYLPISETNAVIRDEKTKSKSNDFSICIIAELIKSLLDEFGLKASIAVLTPYKGQFRKFERMEGTMREMRLENFDNVTISTVDAALGRQFDVVVLDLTVGQSAGFLENENRLNVAMTRARDGFIVVCNKDAIESAYYKRPIPTPYLKLLVPLFEGRSHTLPRNDNFPVTPYYTPSESEPKETA